MTAERDPYTGTVWQIDVDHSQRGTSVHQPVPGLTRRNPSGLKGHGENRVKFDKGQVSDVTPPDGHGAPSMKPPPNHVYQTWSVPGTEIGDDHLPGQLLIPTTESASERARILSHFPNAIPKHA